jgi:hypothetical protein
MIQVTDEMITAANAVVPALTPATVRMMLEAAMLGQLVFADSEGETQVEGKPGKTQYPLYLQIQIVDPHRALEYAKTLLAGASGRLRSEANDVPITLLMAGDGKFSN